MFQNDRVVKDGWVVSLEYTLKYEDGELIAESSEDGMLFFIQGRGHVFTLIEGAVEGMQVGDEMSLTMLPKDTYGEYDEDAIELVPLEAFPDDVEIVEGLEIELYDDESGAEIDATVMEVREDGVVVDMNHPLAGEPLTMWLRVADLRPATEEELEHDHVHGDDIDDDDNDDHHHHHL